MKAMKWHTVIVVLAGAWFCLCAAMPARAAAPRVQVQVQAKQPVLVGQQVRIDVKVMAPNFLMSSPELPQLSIAGAIVTVPDERATLATEPIDGVSYAVVQKSYLFAAQQPGDFTLPPGEIAFTYGGGDGKPVQGSVRLPPLHIRAELPAGATAGSMALPVARMTIRQRFDRPLEGLRTGDAVVRSIEIDAAQTQAMLIPPPHFEAPEGVRLFVADPVLSEQTGANDGFLGGRRIDRVTYVFEHAGHYTLPAVKVRWFDAAANRPAVAEAPAVSLRIAPRLFGGEGIAPPAPVVASDPADRRIDWGRVLSRGVAVLGLGALFLLTRRYGPRGLAWWRARRAAHAVSDAQMFERVLKACAAQDAAGTYRALMAWCARHAGTAAAAWIAQSGDPVLVDQFDRLGRQLYGGDAGEKTWDASGFSAALRRAHSTWQHAKRRRARSSRWAGTPLGPLNPS